MIYFAEAIGVGNIKIGHTGEWRNVTETSRAR